MEAFDHDVYGANQSGAGVRPPGAYDIAGAGSTSWVAGVAGVSPGTLGESAPQYLGLWDTRPADGIPQKTRDLQSFQRGLTPVYDYRGDLQLFGSVALDGSANASSQPDGVGWISPFRDTCLSVLVAGFESLSELAAWSPPAGVVPSPTDPNNRGWEVLRLARYGPNVMPQLAQTGSFRVSLSRWARGARFIAAWLWSYWVGVALPLPITVRFHVLNLPRCPQADLVCVSTPVRTVPDGPLAVADVSSVGRLGLLPGGQQLAMMRWGAVNGGPVNVDVEVR